MKVKHRELPPGRISLHAAAVIMNALQIAVRAQAVALHLRRGDRGRLTKLNRESSVMSLVGVEAGSGVLVIESESSTLLDLPGSAFEEMLAEAKREEHRPPNPGMQWALLALDALFRRDSDVEEIELMNEAGEAARVDHGTMARIRAALKEQASEEGAETTNITGKLLELDLASRSFRVHGPLGEIERVTYEDVLEPLVKDGLDAFVVATAVSAPSGQRELVSLDVVQGVPESSFYERRSLEQIVEEQQVTPLDDIEALAMSGIESIPLETFDDFLRSLRGAGEL